MCQSWLIARPKEDIKVLWSLLNSRNIRLRLENLKWPAKNPVCFQWPYTERLGSHRWWIGGCGLPVLEPYLLNILRQVKGKVLPYSLSSVGPRADPGVQAVSTSSPEVGCNYFPSGLQSPSRRKNVTVLRLIPSYTAWWQRHVGVNNLPKVVTQFCPGGNWTQDTYCKSSTLPLGHCTSLSRNNVKIFLSSSFDVS